MRPRAEDLRAAECKLEQIPALRVGQAELLDELRLDGLAASIAVGQPPQRDAKPSGTGSPARREPRWGTRRIRAAVRWDPVCFSWPNVKERLFQPWDGKT